MTPTQRTDIETALDAPRKKYARSCYRSYLTINEGDRFGLLVVTGAPKKVGRFWSVDCLCDCGRARVIRTISLIVGHTVSCGRHKPPKSHGHARKDRSTREYNSWTAMRARCRLPSNAEWANYGGRGISVCERWNSSFETFLHDMGPCPPGHTLDRIDVNGNYEPLNCRWASAQTQAENMRRTMFVTYRGERISVSGLARRKGLNKATLYYRITRLGWSVEKAAERPIKKGLFPSERNLPPNTRRLRSDFNGRHHGPQQQIPEVV